MGGSNIYTGKADIGQCNLYPQAGRFLQMIARIKKSYSTGTDCVCLLRPLKEQESPQEKK